VLSSRSSRRQIQRALFLAGILLILAVCGPRLLAPSTRTSGSSHGSVVISEFMAAGQSQLADEDGEYPDWIELHNRGLQSVNLLGWSLTDDPAEPDKWMLPSVDLAAGGYLVLFASGKDRPRSAGGPKEIPAERLVPPAELHTNFRLAAEGGYLALYDNTSRRFLDVGSFTYPEQQGGMAYGGCGAPDSACYLPDPTPGEPNDETNAWQGLAAPVTSSTPHGFYDALFEVELSTATPGAEIWYTMDGSEPTEGNGKVYTGPITIPGTTVLRAVAVKADYRSGSPATFSYIFPEQVLRQPEDPPGYPARWGTYGKVEPLRTTGVPQPADYAMDPAVVEDPKYHDRMRDSLLSLPTLSLATGIDNLDIYFVDPLAQGIGSERPVSAEWIDPTGETEGFRVDAGLRIQGKLARSDLVPKHSLRLLFRKAYGSPQLEYELFPGSPVSDFDVLVLRAGSVDSYACYPFFKTPHATYAKDEWMRRSQLAMSGFGARGRFVHLYLNGLYWGVYNLVERPDASFAASYFGGEKEEWLSAKPGGADEGILCRIDSMRRLAELGQMADPAHYAAMLEFIDPVQFSDYLIAHWYAGGKDSFENNWYTAMRQPDGPFLFFAWDDEMSWLNGASVDMGPDGMGDRMFPNIIKSLFAALLLNPDFRVTLADRLYKQISPGGALSDESARARWLEITGELEEAMIAESARWGDTWFDPPITQADWHEGRGAVLAQMNGNAARLLALARAQGYYPPVDPPVFSQAGGSFEGRLRLTMSAWQGDIYYTLDGSDPRAQVTGAVNPAAIQYADAIELSGSTRVRARVLADGVWSAMNEADFVESSQPDGLRITEIMYNPLDGDDYEFLALSNVGAFEVDLSGARFAGIDLRFDRGTRLAGGATMVLAADADAFRSRYPDAPIGAVYSGELSDRGETIVLRDIAGDVLLSLAYDDEDGWPLTADGPGDSLVLTDLTGDANAPSSWQASSVLYGTPGTRGWAGAPHGSPLGPDGASSATAGGAAVPAASRQSIGAKSPQPAYLTNIRFGDRATLVGYDVYFDARLLDPEEQPVVRPGDLLEYILYWRMGQPPEEEAHIELLTPEGESLGLVNRQIGQLSEPQANCSTAELVPDRITVQIPHDAADGLVRPVVSLDILRTGERLDAYASTGERLGDDYRLPWLKITGGAPQRVPQSQPAHAVGIRFGEDLLLAGYDASLNGRPLDMDDLPVVRPGDTLEFVLYWRMRPPAGEQVFMELLTPDGQRVQLITRPIGEQSGSQSAPSAAGLVADRMVVQIPEGAPVGLVQPVVHVYLPEISDRLDVYSSSGERLGADYRLPWLKIIGSVLQPGLQEPVAARFGEQIELLGYSLQPLKPGVQAGQTLTMTLYFRTQAHVGEDLLRFVQLHNAEYGIAAQNDSRPAAGRNPTWAWKTGEVVADEVVMTVAPDAAPGSYRFLVGFYRPEDGARLSVWDEAGDAVPDRALVLAQATVLPAGDNPAEDAGAP
jgi:hypothetical protein